MELKKTPSTSVEIVMSKNANLREPGQLKHLQEQFRQEVGPHLGFDLDSIYKHYAHRRKLRK